MGLKLDKIRKNPAQFLSLTGFSSEEFDELATEFRIEWDQYSSHFTCSSGYAQKFAEASADLQSALLNEGFSIPYAIKE